MTKRAKLLILPLLVLMIVCALTACGGKSYTITFDTQGGSEIESITLKEGDEITLPENPTKNGYTFDGWKLGDEGFTATEMPEQDITLVAKWTAVNYTVIYNLDNGTNGSNPSTYNIETETITLADATKEGYSFVGWFDAATGGSEVETIAKGSTGEKELYARFTANTDTAYTVEHYFETLDGSFVKDESKTQNLSGTTGATVNAAYLTEGITGFGSDDNNINAVASGTIAADDSTVLKLYYTRNSYTITFDSNGGSNVAAITDKYGASIAAPANPTREGYTFASWSAAVPATMPAESITLTAEWIQIYTITYNNMEGAENHADNPTTFMAETPTITLGEPTKTGYIFDAWYANSEFTGDTVTTITKGTTVDVELFANWMIINYTVSYNLDGGTNHIGNPSSYNIETLGGEDGNISLSAASKATDVKIRTTQSNNGVYSYTTTSTYYTFDGWYNAETGGNKVTKLTFGLGTITLYARWVETTGQTDTTGETAYQRIDADGTANTDGEYILFGSYPQSKVADTDTDIILALNNTAGETSTWTSYDYYIEGAISDYMVYTDVTHNGEKYRGVYFTSYRSGDIDETYSNYSYQLDNGYNPSTVYWFKYEPIKWKIVKNEYGYATLVAELILDSQDYYYQRGKMLTQRERADYEGNTATVYDNNYQYSAIRGWLNETFYSTAFSGLQQALIQTVTIDNSYASTETPDNPNCCGDTNDKVWLLSYKEAFSYYFGSNDARLKSGTDYAKAQGLRVWGSSFSSWWLRSPSGSTNTHSADDVSYIGHPGEGYVTYTFQGIVPALKIKLS